MSAVVRCQAKSTADAFTMSMMSSRRVLFPVLVSALSFLSSFAFAERAAPLSALAKLPVTEVTVFKDGHAFVLHQGKLPTNSEGNVLMDHLPTPVLGTFFPYANDRAAKLTAVVASSRRVLTERTALTLEELVSANSGASVLITEKPSGDRTAPLSYAATLIGIPARSGDELSALAPPGTAELLPQKGNVLMLRTSDGVKVVGFDRILDVTFKGPHKTKVAEEEFRNLLTLKLAWNGGKIEPAADVGMLYLQRGLRWIPSYKISLDGAGKATLKLQATLINELCDLEDVNANLVIGVPSFAFKDQLDPMSLGKTLAQLSPYFSPGSQTDNAFSNAIMSQQVMSDDRHRRDTSANTDLGPEISGANRTEDLFVFNVRHITLKKGQRMVLPVTEFTLKYHDLYVLEVPFSPPPELRGHIGSEQQAELARLLSSPKVMHKIRLSNKSSYPLTTAPALILRDGRVLAQGLLTYAAIGADSDVSITTAVELRATRNDRELKRTARASAWLNDTYTRIDMNGTLTLQNFQSQPVEIEVIRYVLGQADSAGSGGTAETINALEDSGRSPSSSFAWGNYSWPDWWQHFNGLGRFVWNSKLLPGKSTDLSYAWHYFIR